MDSVSQNGTTAIVTLTYTVLANRPALTSLQSITWHPAAPDAPGAGGANVAEKINTLDTAVSITVTSLERRESGGPVRKGGVSQVLWLRW